MSFNKTSLVIVTGASRGLGQGLAVSAAKDLANRKSEGFQTTRFLVIARSAAALDATKQQILQHLPTAEVFSISMELSNLSTLAAEFANALDTALAGVNAGDLQDIRIFHNAGILGPVGHVGSMSPEKIIETVNTNITSFYVLNSVFISKLQNVTKDAALPPLRVRIVGITSQSALHPHSHWALYGGGCAARDMALATLATEAAEVFPASGRQVELKTLSYAPGQVQTDMLNEAAGHQQHFRDLIASGQVLTPEVSGDKLMSVLLENTYASGAHVYYRDLVA